MLLRPLQPQHTYRHIHSTFRIPSVPRRTFFPNPLPSPPKSSQSLHARRYLPYPSSSLYTLVSNIPSYPLFLPFCTGAKILTYSAPDAVTRARHPATASLSVGWKGIEEQFVSRVYCLPDKGIVEAVSGSEGLTSLSEEELQTWGYNSQKIQERGPGEADDGNEIFRSLRTRWSLERLGDEKGTNVDLTIEVEWKNMIYAAMAQTTMDKVAGVMIGAFERRAKEVLG